MENKLNTFVCLLNEMGADYNVRFSVKTRIIISSATCREVEISVYFENDDLGSKRLLRFKQDQCGDGDVTRLCNSVALNLLRYIIFAKDSVCDGFDLGRGVIIESFSSKTIFSKNEK